MIIESKNLINITLGTAGYEINSDGMFVPHRFTAKQRDFYKNSNPDFYKKTFASAGIKLDFETDADNLSFDCVMRQSSSRPFCFTDVYCDGIMLAHLGEKITEPSLSMHVSVPLPSGKHRVTVYFPNLVSVAVGDLSLDGASYFVPHKPKYKFYCVGDSITQGYDAIYPSLSYANKIGAHFDAETLNQAIGGEIFNPGMPDGELPFKPDLVTIAYGTNDWSHQTSVESFQSNARGFFKRITEIFSGVKTVYISPIWRSALEGEPYDRPIPRFSEGVKMLEEIASEFPEIITVHGSELTPHVEDFYSDGYLHPNDLGFSVYSEKLVGKLEKLL